MKHDRAFSTRVKELRLFGRAAIGSAEAGVVLAMAILAGTSFFYALLTARWLGPTSRGSLVVFMTTSSFLMIVGSLGVGTGSRVLLNKNPPLSLQNYLKQARVLSALHLLTSSSIGLFVLAKTGGMPTILIGVFFIPFATVQLFSYFQREALHAIGRHRTALYADAMASTLQAFAVILLNASGIFNLTVICVVVLGGSLSQTVFLAARLRAQNLNPPFASYSLGDLVKYGRPALITTLGQALVIRGDRLLLGLLAGAAPVGVYGTAATLTEVLWLIPGAVAQVAFRRASITGTHRSGLRARRFTLLITAVAGVALAASTQVIVELFLGPDYADAAGLAYILIAASLPMASYQLDVAVLNGLGRLAASGRATTLGTFVLTAGCLVAIPKYGAYGAAWSSVAAYSTMAALARIQLRRAMTATTVRSEG